MSSTQQPKPIPWILQVRKIFTDVQCDNPNHWNSNCKSSFLSFFFPLSNEGLYNIKLKSADISLIREPNWILELQLFFISLFLNVMSILLEQVSFLFECQVFGLHYSCWTQGHSWGDANRLFPHSIAGIQVQYNFTSYNYIRRSCWVQPAALIPRRIFR